MPFAVAIYLIDVLRTDISLMRSDGSPCRVSNNVVRLLKNLTIILHID